MSYSLALPVLRLVSAETAHRMTIGALRSAELFLAKQLKNRRPSHRLAQNLWGMTFANPIGLAAGADKNAEAIKGVLSTGFGFAEFGTITPNAQPGNETPRVFRLNRDKAVINRYGLNNDGADAAANHLKKYRQWHKKGAGGIVGINIGAHNPPHNGIGSRAYLVNRIADYATVAEKLANYADYLTINLSCPNTPGMPNMQSPEVAGEVVKAVRDVTMTLRTPPPILAKLSPDLPQTNFYKTLDRLAECGVDGIILTNTTTRRPSNLVSRHRHQQGGLSGPPLFKASTQALATARQHLGKKMILVGVGGVDSPAAAYAKILAGASLVQLYTALAFQGPALVRHIIQKLEARLADDNIRHISDAVGQASSANEAIAIATSCPNHR